MKPTDPGQLDELVRQVRLGGKYASIDAALVASIGAAELAKRSSLKEAVKTTRNKLHQVGAAYQERPIPYPELLQQLSGLQDDLSAAGVHDYLTKAMGMHASTAERLSIHESFFFKTLESLGPIESILDLACGFNPLNLPWMPVAANLKYMACDIYCDMTGFLKAFFGHFHVNGLAFICDLTNTVPHEKVQLALLLKTIPCLEQVDKSAGKKLLDGIDAENILVSFPAHSLGGRSKGMVQNYEAHFHQLIEGRAWQVTRFEFPGELAFLVRK